MTFGRFIVTVMALGAVWLGVSSEVGDGWALAALGFAALVDKIGYDRPHVVTVNYPPRRAV